MLHLIQLNLYDALITLFLHGKQALLFQHTLTDGYQLLCMPLTREGVAKGLNKEGNHKGTKSTKEEHFYCKSFALTSLLLFFVSFVVQGFSTFAAPSDRAISTTSCLY